MAFNITSVIDINLDAYITGNSVAIVAWFMFMALPALILCLLCMLALCFATVNLKIKIALMNVLVSEVALMVSLSVRQLGFLARSRIPTKKISCSSSISGTAFSGVVRFSAIALYSVMVYVILKYGVSRFKYRYMIPYNIVSWVIGFAFSAIPYLPGFIVKSSVSATIGLCAGNSEFFLFRAVAPAIPATYFVCLCVTVTFSALSYHFFKKNVIQGENASIKKAVAKNLIYYVVVAVVAFVANILIPVNSRIRSSLASQAVLYAVVFDWCSTLLFSLPTLATPVMTIALLEPVRTTLKVIIRKFCGCPGNNCVSGEETIATEGP